MFAPLFSRKIRGHSRAQIFDQLVQTLTKSESENCPIEFCGFNVSLEKRFAEADLR